MNIKKLVGAVGVAVATAAAPVVSFATGTAPTTVTELAGSVDTSDAKGGVLVAAGLLIVVSLTVYGVKKVIAFFGK